MSLRRSTRIPVQRVTYIASTAKSRTEGSETNETNVAKKVSKKTSPSKAKSITESTSVLTDEQPVTPNRKRKQRGKAVAADEPITPTPAAVGLMTSSYSTGDIDDATPPPEKRRAAIPRPAQPHMTNALLRTPKGSRIPGVTQTNSIASTINDAAKADTGAATTTNNLLEVASAYLCKQDPRLQKIVDEHHCYIFSPEGLAEEVDPFRSIASGIMGQQVSGAAAKAIKNKFMGLFQESEGSAPRFPTPEEVRKTDLPRLRQAGLSQRKAEYIQGLAEKFSNGELSAQMLANASDEEVMEKLVAVRGLGRWSVEMFMCFGLKRMDIFSTGDLGVQRGMAAYVGRDVAKLKAKGGGKWKYMSEKDMLELSAKFAPYRSLFMWLMWRVEDVDIDAVQGT